MSSVHFVWRFKESLSDDGEELGGVGCSIGVDERVSPAFEVSFKPVEFGAEHLRPTFIKVVLAQDGRTVGDAVFLVELVGELMEHDVVPIGTVAGAFFDLIPRDDDRSLAPRFTEVYAAGFGDCSSGATLNILDDERGGIDEDCAKPGEVSGVAVEEEKAGVSGDGDLDFIRDGEARASFEMLFGQQDVDVALEFFAVS